MFGNNGYYNESIRKYITIFGTLFNDIQIIRKNNATDITEQTLRVPVNYGPIQKYIAMLLQDPTKQAQAITLPRIVFENTNIMYDAERKLNRSSIVKNPDGSFNTPIPYNIEFQLFVMAKNKEDGEQIVETILPYFSPDFTVTAKLLSNSERLFDVPIVLNGVTAEDTYEGSYDERRSLIWTLTFTLKGYFFGPTVSDKKEIKLININLFTDLTATKPEETVNIQPGSTVANVATTDINQSRFYQDIEKDDNWAVISRIIDNGD